MNKTKNKLDRQASALLAGVRALDHKRRNTVLVALLGDYFALCERRHGPYSSWAVSEVWRVLATWLRQIGRLRNRPRGNPAKGGAVAQSRHRARIAAMNNPGGPDTLAIPAERLPGGPSTLDERAV